MRLVRSRETTMSSGPGVPRIVRIPFSKLAEIPGRSGVAGVMRASKDSKLSRTVGKTGKEWEMDILFPPETNRMGAISYPIPCGSEERIRASYYKLDIEVAATANA